MTTDIKSFIAKQLQLAVKAVENTLSLLDEGCTIPFISRYRKEKTGGLDEVQIGNISQLYEKLKELIKRKETIIKTINELGKMTKELQQRIDDCWDSTELEDIYLPYKPKRRTRAQVARELGLEPLATAILLQREQNPEQLAKRFVKEGVKDAETAIKGAQDIIAETISEDEDTRNRLRNTFRREAYITSKVVKAKQDSDEAAKYSDYFDFEEPLRRCTGNRLLAMRRGEAEGILRISINVDNDEAISDNTFMVAAVAKRLLKRLARMPTSDFYAQASRMSLLQVPSSRLMKRLSAYLQRTFASFYLQPLLVRSA